MLLSSLIKPLCQYSPRARTHALSPHSPPLSISQTNSPTSGSTIVERTSRRSCHRPSSLFATPCAPRCRRLPTLTPCNYASRHWYNTGRTRHRRCIWGEWHLHDHRWPHDRRRERVFSMSTSPRRANRSRPAAPPTISSLRHLHSHSAKPRGLTRGQRAEYKALPTFCARRVGNNPPSIPMSTRSWPPR